MSKFIDKLKRLSQVEPESIGFRPHQPTSPKPKIQLVTSLASKKLDHLADAVAGADAVLLPVAQGNPDVLSLAKITQAMTDIPWGGWLKGGQSGIAELIKAGCDFVVFPAAQTPLTAVADSKVGKILEVDASLGDGLLRAINELPIDAALVAGGLRESDSLTWQHLMLFRRFAALLTKPLLVPVPSNVGADELQALWEAGVDGVVIEATTRERLKELRHTIDGLTFPLPRRKEKVEAVLPRIGHELGQVVAEEEEEEEDEE